MKWWVRGGLAVLLLVPLHAEKLVKVKNLKKGDMLTLMREYPPSAVQMRRGDEYELILDDEAIGFLETRGYEVEVILDMEVWRKEIRKWLSKSDYHTYSTFVQDFVSLAQTYPDLAKLDTIGFSVEGRAILCLKISDNVDIRENEPEVRIVGTHHGNEWISTEIPILFAHYLLENYGVIGEVTYLVNNREIYIIPMFNPDGHEAQTRYNANGVDLNRDYGYMWEGWGGSSSPYSQPETQAMFEFSRNHNFTLSLSYHSYGEIVNYIWNYSPIEPPDSNLIREYSNGYANFNGYWVTEGYDWYETHGDLNDYSYGIDSDIDWTIELGQEFIPPSSQIDPIFNENKDAMLYILKQAGQGIGGVLIDTTTQDTVKEFRVYVEGNPWPVYSDRVTGDFVKVLLPGTYNIRFEANGYATSYISGVTVYEDSLTWIVAYTHPDEGVYGYKFVWANISDPNNSFNNHTLTPYALGAPDGVFLSLGVGGDVVIDMGERSWIKDGFTVYEGDDGIPGEGYTVYVSQNWNGPWYSLGVGYGIQGFDISSTGLDSIRYVRIVDDGDGNPNASTPGFDLDAIKAGPPSYPDIAVTPLLFTVTLEPEEADTELLTIANEGEASLTFNIKTILNKASKLNKKVYGITKKEPQKGEPDKIKGTPQTKGSGGPDDFGYTWIDSDEPGGPEFNWVEISTTGTPLYLGDDDYAEISLPFGFPFYGNLKTTLKISSNGYITFGTDGTDYSNDSVPDPTDPNDLIAVFWDDLNPSAGGQVYYYVDETEGMLIVEWSGVPHYYNSGSYTFEVILHESGDMLFLYKNMDGELTSATIGIENQDASIGLQVVYNATYVRDNLALLISAKEKWLEVEPASGTVGAGGSININVIFNSASLDTGVYEGEILILSNDPDEDSIHIPVTMYVVSFIPGDVNGDGVVNSDDFIYLGNYLFYGGPSPQPLLSGDTNGDCSVNSDDFTYLGNYFYFGGPAPVRCSGEPSRKSILIH